MSTSFVHVLTIIGSAAAEVEAACNELLDRRVPRHPKGYGTEDWSESDQKEITGLCSALIEFRRDLPVLYYAQYLDGSSVAASQFRLLEWPDGKKRWLYGSECSLTYYASQDGDSFRAQIRTKRRTKLYRTQPEDRWYLDHLWEALMAPAWLQAPFLVVSISETLGFSRHDDEIKAALDLPIGLAKLGFGLSTEDNA